MLKKLLERFGYVPDVPDVPDMVTELKAAERALARARVDAQTERVNRLAADRTIAELARRLAEAQREIDRRVFLSDDDVDALRRIRLSRMREQSLAIAS